MVGQRDVDDRGVEQRHGDAEDQDGEREPGCARDDDGGGRARRGGGGQVMVRSFRCVPRRGVREGARAASRARRSRLAVGRPCAS